VPKPAPNPALRRLDALVGEWEVHVSMPEGAAIAGRAVFEWLGGPHFLVQRSSAEHPDMPDGLSLIGWDDDAGTCVMHYFDSRGVVRRYDVSLDDRVWTVERDGPDFAQRFTGTFSEDGRTIEGAWERSDDGSSWEHDFDLTYTRVA
jgi:hypothetical protein